MPWRARSALSFAASDSRSWRWQCVRRKRETVDLPKCGTWHPLAAGAFQAQQESFAQPKVICQQRKRRIAASAAAALRD
jgi:hypothetical protein